MVEADAIDFRIDVPQAPAPLKGFAAEIRAHVRRELGLSPGVVMGAGHQPVVWHAGLLAKFIAASADAAALAPAEKKGVWLHFVSDQDLVEPSRIELPVREVGGAVRRSSLQYSTAWARSNDRCTSAWYPPFAPSAPSAVCASEMATAARDAFMCQLGANQRESSAALQFAKAVGSCAHAWTGQPALVIGSAALLRAAAPLVDQILREPERSAVAFNEALREDPHAARPLRVAGDRSEVPLWRVASSGLRERVRAEEARSAIRAGELLLPRAFLASGLLRICCDCFYHGTGGARYERVSEHWWRRFFGIDLPPFGVATATLLPTPSALGLQAAPARPRISHRRLWWNPHLLSSDRSQHDARAALVERIAQAPRRSAERAARYAALHECIARDRSVAAAELDQILREEGMNRSRHAQASLAHDRTWPFLLLERASVDALAAAITRAVRRARRDPQIPRDERRV
ncbi:MAG: hypothetical protein FJ256_03000 [Phycisphaerae bacterium]|nr:hypothetical protein [Phycisphaerae bacterium]